MKIINTTSMPIRQAKDLYCFGGYNLHISTENIKTVEFLFWNDYKQDDYIPVLLFTLNDGTQLSIDYETEQQAEKELKEYKKQKIKVIKSDL